MTRTIRILCVASLTIVGLVGSSLPARAGDRDERNERHEKCERQIRQAEDKLHDAIRRHGEGSRQAHRRHEQLEEVRRRCDDHHDRDHHDNDRDQH
jgi:ABC-type nickel/cobalt efflux system permease component RcnA